MAVISSLQSGIPLNSTGNPLKSGEVTIADASGFFPIYNNTTGQLMTGGAFLTVQVGPGTPGAINTVIAGQALTLSVEYNSLGQFRFDVYPKGANGYVITSPFFPINTEHSVAVSYDTSSGMTVLSVDGASQTAYSSYSTASATTLVPGKTLGSSLLGSTSNPATFNGFLGQIALFSQAPTISALNTMTTDPAGANSAFFASVAGVNPVGHIESQSNSFATINSQSGASSSSTSVLNVATLNGIQIGDTVTDVTSPFTNPVYVVAMSNNGVSKTTTTTTTTGTTSVLTLASVTGIQVNDLVADNTTPLLFAASVTTIDTPNKKVTLSVNTDTFASADSLTFYRTGLGSNNASITLNQATGSSVGNNDTLVFTHPNNSTVYATEGSSLSTITNVWGAQPTTWTTQTSASSTPANSVLAVAAGSGIQVGDFVTDITKPLTNTNDIVTAVNGNSVTSSIFFKEVR